MIDDRMTRLNEVAHIAVALQTQTGCPAQLMTAQWAVESLWGAKPAGHANYFGIKKAARHEMCCTVTTRALPRRLEDDGSGVRRLPVAGRLLQGLCLADHAGLAVQGRVGDV